MTFSGTVPMMRLYLGSLIMIESGRLAGDLESRGATWAKRPLLAMDANDGVGTLLVRVSCIAAM